jgi:hypothetical protein
MSVPLTVNGAVFNYPVDFDTQDWAIDATGWAQAVTNALIQKSGGSFPLTGDINFGASFGLIAPYFTSRAANPSTVGTLRLASADPGVGFRNNANSGNLILTTDASDNLLYNGHIIGASASGPVTSITGTANQVIASASTGPITLSLPQSIALTSSPTFAGLTVTGLTASSIVATNGSSVLTTLTDPLSVTHGGTGDASLTAYSVLCGGTTGTGPVQSVVGLGLSGQALTSNGAATLPTWQNVAGSGTVNTGTTPNIPYYATSSNVLSDSGISRANLFLADGTVPATGAFNLASHKITNLTNGSSAQDAVAFTQLTTGNAITAGGIASATITATQVASNTLTGSTANSGGSAGNIAQGTISTPDLRANAVTQFIEKSADAGGHSVSGFTILDTITITSLGGPILLSANVDLSVGQTGAGIVWSLAIWANSSTSGLPGAFGTHSVDGQTGGAQDNVVTLQGSDTPVAGTNSYHLGYKIVQGTSTTVSNYNFRALELRA